MPQNAESFFSGNAGNCDSVKWGAERSQKKGIFFANADDSPIMAWKSRCQPFVLERAWLCVVFWTFCFLSTYRERNRGTRGQTRREAASGGVSVRQEDGPVQEQRARSQGHHVPQAARHGHVCVSVPAGLHPTTVRTKQQAGAMTIWTRLDPHATPQVLRINRPHLFRFPLSVIRCQTLNFEPLHAPNFLLVLDASIFKRWKMDVVLILVFDPTADCQFLPYVNEFCHRFSSRFSLEM